MYANQTVEGFWAFEPFVLLLSSVDLRDARIVICKREKIPFDSKSHRCNWPNKVRIYKLVRPLCSFLRRIVVVFYYLCPFTAITYVLIVSIANIVMGLMFSYSLKVEVTKSFVPNCKEEFVALSLVDFRLYIFVEVAFGF